MTAIIMDGLALANRLKPELQSQAADLKDRYGCTPSLTAVMVGEDAASDLYVRNKRRLAAELGFSTDVVKLAPAEATTDRLLDVIAGLNHNPEVTGILIQLPVPESVDKFRLFDAIDPNKDVDAVGLASLQGFYRGEWGRFIPCTPRGVMSLLGHYKVPTEGVLAAVIGRNDISGKPTAMILGGRLGNATVTWCHRYTRPADLAAICRQSDIIVSCVGADIGRPFLITSDMVKPGACVIDVGVRRLGPGRFIGDVDFDGAKQVAGWITPSPGGTGPMTVLALMQNLIDAARYQLGLQRVTYST